MTGSDNPDRESPARCADVVDQDRSQRALTPRRSLRWLGLALRVVGWSNLILAVGLLISLPFLLQRFQVRAATELQPMRDSFQKASEELGNQLTTLDRLDDLLASAAGLSGGIDESLTAVTPLLDDLASFLGDQMPETLESTELSLRSASDGAAAIDSLLRLLSKIPFLGSIEYAPSQPLDTSLLQAADGIAPLEAPLIVLQGDLNRFSAALSGIHPEIRSTELALEDFQRDLGGLKKAVKSNGETFASLAATVDGIQDHLPGIIVGLGLFLGWSLLWFTLVNTVLIIQGTRIS